MKLIFLVFTIAFTSMAYSQTDPTRFTDVIVTNQSTISSVQCFLTVQSTDSAVGKFGISQDSLLSKTTGWFWVKKGDSIHLGSTSPSIGYIISFGAQNQACSSAINAGWENGINNFEFTLNCYSTKHQPESADITNVDGVNAIIKYSVDTSKGTIGRKFWDYSKMNSSGTQLLMFDSAQTSGHLFGDCNIPGIFPYHCDLCNSSSSGAPVPCWQLPPTYNCSNQTKYNICQINRPGQGGVINVNFLGFTSTTIPPLAKKHLRTR